ncbi:unnamed protein product [Caretta caretta]
MSESQQRLEAMHQQPMLVLGLDTAPEIKPSPFILFQTENTKEEKLEVTQQEPDNESTNDSNRNEVTVDGGNTGDGMVK